MLIELIKIALASLAGSRLRTALSALGIVIGIGSVVAVSNFGQSATTSVKSDVASQGLGVLMVVPGRDADKATERIFVRSLSGKMAKNTGGLDAVLPVNSERFSIRARDKKYSADVLAVEPALFPLFHLSPSSGSLFSKADCDESRSVAILGDEIASSLFGDADPVGCNIKLIDDNGARGLKVIGRLKTRDSAMGIDFDASVFIPFDTFGARFHRTQRVQRYLAVVSKGGDDTKAAENLKAYLSTVTGNPDSYRVMSPASLAGMLSGITSTLDAFLTAVAAISLLVGGIGIMNIMLVSVTERTKEIGIRKALGASAGTIKAQFLLEAIVLTFAGGVLGVGLGLGISYLATLALGWSFSPSMSSILVALGFSSFVGLFFGWSPAARAARLNPVEALMYE